MHVDNITDPELLELLQQSAEESIPGLLSLKDLCEKDPYFLDYVIQQLDGEKRNEYLKELRRPTPLTVEELSTTFSLGFLDDFNE